jgi:hypothetical protein
MGNFGCRHFRRTEFERLQVILQEEVMKTFSRPIVKYFSSVAFLALAVLTLTPNSVAKDQPPNLVAVIAHLPLPGTSVTQMSVQQKGSKQYLYVQQRAKPEPLVIDVTKANQPEVIGEMAMKADGEKLDVVGPGLALAETPETSGSGTARHALVPARGQGAGGSQATESVRVLDLSDPKNPKTLQTFAGVTSILADDGRKLIYIANGEGLWILKHVEKRSIPHCDSESVFSEIADCQ